MSGGQSQKHYLYLMSSTKVEVFWPGTDEKQLVEGYWEGAASKGCKKAEQGNQKQEKKKRHLGDGVIKRQ